MGRRTRRFNLLGGVTASLLALGITTALLTSASAAPDQKSYSLGLTAVPAVAEDDSPADPAVETYAGDSPALTLTLMNTSSSQSLGSADITLPNVIWRATNVATTRGTATVGPGNVLSLRSLSLAPGGSVAVSFTADIQCTPPTPTTTAFSATVKQANDFLGAGNDFVAPASFPELDPVGQCSLRFAAQPADAEVNTAITSEIFKPTGVPVTVTVVDGSGSSLVEWWNTGVTLAIGTNPGGGQLSSANNAVPTVVPALGIAAFNMGNAPRIDKIGSGYTLRASSGTLTPRESQATGFNIVTYGRPCNGNGERCSSGTLNANKSTAEVSALASQGDLLRASLFNADSPAAPAFQCTGYTTTTDVLDFDLITSTGGATNVGKTVVFTLKKAFATRAANKYEVCWQTPLPFTTKSGAPAAGNAVDWYVGILPTCARRDPVAPCSQPGVKDRDGNVVITILAPPGDPRAKF